MRGRRELVTPQLGHGGSASRADDEDLLLAPLASGARHREEGFGERTLSVGLFRGSLGADVVLGTETALAASRRCRGLGFFARPEVVVGLHAESCCGFVGGCGW